MPQCRKGPFKGKGADSRGARREAPARRKAAPTAAPIASGSCGRRSPVQGWTLIGAIAVRTSSLVLAARVADRVRPILAGDGLCRIDALQLRWMRLPQFYRHIGALP